MMWVVWVMDGASFERVYDSLQEFHAFFAASFGRKQWRDHSGNLPSGAAGAGPGAAQRRESLGIGGHLGPGDAALSHRGPVVR